MSMFGGQKTGVSDRDAKRIASAEILQAVRDLHTGMTDVIGQIAGRMTNDVLTVKTELIGTDGYVTESFRVPVGAVKVRNLGAAAADITVHAAGPSDAAPTNGTGVWVIPAGMADLVPIGGNRFTIYGAAGTRVSYQAFAGAARPVAG